MKRERSNVNLANQITIFRILLIPVFIGLVIYYGDSARGEHPNEALRQWAAAVFGIASISDAVDGWIARRFNQRTRFGAIMDPLADKLLMLAAIILLSFTSWRQHFPLWFPILVIGRDLLSIGGGFLIDPLSAKFQNHTHPNRKNPPFFHMAAHFWILPGLKAQRVILPPNFCATFTPPSGFFHSAGRGKPI